MWRRPSAAVQRDALELLAGAHLKDPAAAVYDVECDRIFFVSASNKARVAIVHCSDGSRLVRSVIPGWPA